MKDDSGSNICVQIDLGLQVNHCRLEYIEFDTTEGLAHDVDGKRGESCGQQMRKF